MGLRFLELLFLEELEEDVLEGVFFADAFGVWSGGGVAEADLVLPSAIFVGSPSSSSSSLSYRWRKSSKTWLG